MENNKNDASPDPVRQLGYWLRTVDHLLAARMAEAVSDEEVGRREWMLLNLVSGDIAVPGIAERLARRGKKLQGLRDRGWITEVDGTWTLTEEGRAARDRLAERVSAIRSEVTAAVSPEDLATTTATLEAVARGLGWNEENARLGHRGFGRRHGRHGYGRGFGPGFGPRGFGRGFGPGFGGGFGPGHDAPERGFGPGHGRGHGFDHADAGHCGRHAEHGTGEWASTPDAGPTDSRA